MTTTWIILLTSLLFSAFCSGMEIAFLSSSKLRIELDKQRHPITTSILGVFYNRPDRYISTILVGNNIALVIYGIQMSRVLDAALHPFVGDAVLMVLITLISTLIVLVTGEFIPKMLCKANPNFWMNTFALPMLLVYIVLYPIAIFMSTLSRGIMRLFGIRVDKQGERMLGRVDLGYWLQESVERQDGEEEIDQEVKIFQNALDFSKVKLRDCMVPRTEIEAVDMDCSLAELTQRFVNSGFSKLVVYKEDIDHIVGYVHSTCLFEKPTKWQDKLILLPIVPETMAANKLMNLLLLKKKSMAVVVDEFGGTAGLVSLEDIIEEIFGEIEDEHDTQEYILRPLDEHSYLLSGRLEVDNLNEQLGLQLPVSEDYMTVAGLLLYVCQGFPPPKEEVHVGDYIFTVVKATQNKIELVKLIKP